MNTTFQKRQYNGFNLSDTLMSRLNFQGIFRVDDKKSRTLHNPDKDKLYWTICDEFGARVSCFDRRLAESIIIGEVYKVSGEIKIGKGGTFLNLKEAQIFNGSEYKDAEL